MLRTIRAKFTNGALKPLQKPDLEEGAEVILSIEEPRPRTEPYAP